MYAKKHSIAEILIIRPKGYVCVNGCKGLKRERERKKKDLLF